ncbi:AAA family ATPase [Hujiaoplasma nucleasis]|uniref:AAA family ATPase n=1 Tax=Hujiaoplasma nucleasis TaxID=2725268 RepID=A0A7L6N7X4_9MOLU|nr:AAA family ATPase [Hujiaoplasma nucleasis]QLY40644.1 AAA family ATPase [Hujiaoplasma nucleasis]
MEKISIYNLRSLKKIKDIEIKNLTVLIGKNSSGKSTFLRVFPLLKQSITTRTSDPILWYGKLVDFGEYDDAKSKDSKEDIAFTFHFDAKEVLNKRPYIINSRRYYSFGFYNGFFRKELKGKVECKVYIKENIFSKIDIIYQSQKFSLKYEVAKKEYNLLINDSVEKSLSFKVILNPERFLPTIIMDRNNTFFDDFIDNKSVENLAEKLKTHTRKGTKSKTIVNYLSNIDFGEKKDIYNELLKKNGPKTLKKYIKSLKYNDNDFMKINNQIVLPHAAIMFELSNSFFDNLGKNIHYIEPLRARASRYYRVQGIYIDEIDPTGENIHMFLASLKKDPLEEFRMWTRKHFGFMIKTMKEQGHISLYIQDDESKDIFNVTDMGFGFSQIIPIVVLLWKIQQEARINSRNFREILICIEQPELHLHPAFQAKLIDAFITIINLSKKSKHINVKFVIETHSETIVNRISSIISNNIIDKELSNILIFDKKDNSTNIMTGKFNSDGYIENWPLGFFDAEDIKC